MVMRICSRPQKFRANQGIISQNYLLRCIDQGVIMFEPRTYYILLQVYFTFIFVFFCIMVNMLTIILKEALDKKRTHLVSLCWGGYWKKQLISDVIWVIIVLVTWFYVIVIIFLYCSLVKRTLRL